MFPAISLLSSSCSRWAELQDNLLFTVSSHYTRLQAVGAAWLGQGQVSEHHDRSWRRHGHIQTEKGVYQWQVKLREKISIWSAPLILLKMTVQSPINKLHFGVKWNSYTSSCLFHYFLFYLPLFCYLWWDNSHWWTIISSKEWHIFIEN